MLDVFNGDAFNVINLSIRMNLLPFVAGQIGSKGIFDTAGIETLFVGIEKRDNSLSMVGLSPRGGPGEVIKHDPSTLKLFPVPHFQRDDSVLADEVQGRRLVGTDDQVESVLQRLDFKLARHYRDFDLTLEHQRMGALKGLVVDKNGTTIYNLFSEFGISQPSTFHFNLDDATVIVRAQCETVVQSIEDVLDVPYASIGALAGPTFWSKLISHKSVRETYLNTAQAAELRGDTPDTMDFGNITWERYRTGRKGKAANGASPFVADDEAQFYVKGVPDLYITRFAPADYIETVNTIGLPRYAKQYQMANGKGINVEVQSNPASMCTRPEVCMKANAGAS